MKTNNIIMKKPYVKAEIKTEELEIVRPIAASGGDGGFLPAPSGGSAEAEVSQMTTPAGW